MRKTLKKRTALALALILLLQLVQPGAVLAAEADRALNPAEQIELTVPEALRDGGNYFFLAQSALRISENSAEKLYIPIQRTGSTEQAADVTVKLMDLTARGGVNYEVEVYGGDEAPETYLTDETLVDLFQNAALQQEVEVTDEEGLGELIHSAGGAALVNAEGQEIGAVTTTPVDEDGNPIESGQSPASAVETADPAGSDVARLKAAGNAYTGAVSDRQDMASAESFFEEAEAADEAPAPLAEDLYPGTEYTLHFEKDQEARFLVITPRYSAASDGDCVLMILIKDCPEDWNLAEDYLLTNVTITDEDAPEQVVISMASEQVTAADGVASITVTREGSINDIVGVRLSSRDGTAAEGDDYGGVGANLYFPMGIRERTVQLPVGAGTQEKDFYVTLTPLERQRDVEIGAATTRVVIPAAEAAEPEAVLTASDPYGEKWNLRDRKALISKRVEFRDNDTGVYMETDEDELETQYIALRTDSVSAWDGVHVEYNIHTWYSMVKFEVDKWVDGSWKNIYSRDHGDCATRTGQSADAYYDSVEAPYTISLDDWCYEVHNGFRDSYTDLTVKGVYPIKRTFNISVQPPEGMDWLGTNIYEPTYTAFQVDDSSTSQLQLQTLDDFSVNARKGPEYARLVDVVAIHPNDPGRSMSIGGLRTEEAPNGVVSRSVVVTLSENTIDRLDDYGFIRWTRSSNGSYTGSITCRPVFTYMPVTVYVTETASDLGYLEYRNAAGNWVRMYAGREYSFHMGDQPDIRTVVTAGNYKPVGVAYSLHRDSKTGEFFDSGLKDMGELNVLQFDRQAYYKLTPVFTEASNNLTVRINAQDLASFDTGRGLFAGAEKQTGTGYAEFTVARDILCNQIMSLAAYTKDPNAVPVWTVPGDSTRYSGNIFYHMTGPRVTDNVILLSAANAADCAWYSVSGAVFTKEINLSTGNTTGALTPANQAVLVAQETGAVTDDVGGFTIPPLYLAGETKSRYLVTYNGTPSIQAFAAPNAALPKKTVEYQALEGDTPVTRSVQAINVSNQYPAISGVSAAGAHFVSVRALQDGVAPDNMDAVIMNGKQLSLTLDIDPGQPYLKADGTLAEETVKDVKLFFRNMYTGEVHGVYTTEGGTDVSDPKVELSADGKTATLTIKKFSPDAPDKYSPGDALFAQLITDKDVGYSDLGEASGVRMAYNPVTTGIAVVTDRNFEPETFSLDPTKMLSFSSETPGTDGEGRATYGKFPFLGEITLAVSIFSVIKSALSSKQTEQVLDRVERMSTSSSSSSTIENWDDDSDIGELKSDEADQAQLMGILPGSPTLSFALRIRETPYGGVRFMFAGVAMWGAGSSSSIKGPDGTSNPYDSQVYAMKALGEIAEDRNFALLSGDLVKNTDLANISGAYAKIGGYVGFYMDWGYIELEESGKLSHYMVLLGAGGFFGFQGALGYTQHVLVICVPAYFNGEFSADVSVFLGGSENPRLALDDYSTQKHHDGQSWELNVEVYGNASVSLTVGVGFYKLLGARVTGALSVEAGFSKNMADWFPGVGENWGYSAGFSLSGTLDLLFTSIPLGKFSWPALVKDGFIGYFSNVRKGNQLIKMIEQKPQNTPDETCREKLRALKDYIDSYSGTIEKLGSLVGDLREYAHDHGIISDAQYWQSIFNMTGIAGSIMDAVLTEDKPEPSTRFRVREHVDSEWVAGEDAGLMSAFGRAGTKTLVENSYKLPNAKLLPINDTQMLMVFLWDNPDRDRLQPTQLMWTVYDTGSDTWTDPVPVQADSTGDGKPNLVDAGDRLILSWSSTAPEKYERLKADVAAELEAGGNSAPTRQQVLDALEQQPARVLAQMDIYTAEFDKAGKRFGAIRQLTDDGYYDDDPQAIYDAGTEDYIVMYVKTAQDSAAYTDADRQLLDLIDPYTAEKTYAMLCYMLYNGKADPDAGYPSDAVKETVPAGWVTGHLYDNEFDDSMASYRDPDSGLTGIQGFLKAWGGQRFLRPTIRDDSGRTILSDPPIADLTVSLGYNGLAAYAYTVDTDYNVDTAEDKNLYVQFYRFATHSTYVPVKIAGDMPVEQVRLPEDTRQSGYEVLQSTEQVEVGDPKLIRNDGSTWLFWRQNNEGLKYVNISELLNRKLGVSDDPNGEDWTYAVLPDGTFANDPITGERFVPFIRDVDFGGVTNSGKMNITEYQVLTDAEDNFYVVWTDTTLFEGEASETGTALEIYATAKIGQDAPAPKTAGGELAAWSKPFRLTEDCKRNDGIALALDGSGNLIVVHNQYSFTDLKKDPAYLAQLYNALVAGEDFPNTEREERTDLMVTRFAPVGAVEVSSFAFSEEHPNPGDTVTVTAQIDNAGLTTARQGYSVDFYEFKDGRRGRKIASAVNSEPMPVNTAEAAVFQWTVPEEGADGYSIQAAATETGFSNTVESRSETFEAAPVFSAQIESVRQNGDAFDVVYTVKNIGNKPAPAGAVVDLNVIGIYGDLKDRYGMDNRVLDRSILKGTLAPGSSRTKTLTVANGNPVRLPVSLFRFCGYDALQVCITDGESGETLCASDAAYVTLDEPQNLELNSGSALCLRAGETARAGASFETIAFLPESKVLYSVADPGVASVDEAGEVTALRGGSTTLTATLLPSGKRVSIPLRVAQAAENPFADVAEGSYYYDSVLWAAGSGVTNGVDATHFAPDSGATRAQVVTFLWRAAGRPEPRTAVNPFKDVRTGNYYYKAVLWALQEGITTGTSETTFRPDQTCTRAQIVTFLWRYAGKPEPEQLQTRFTDVAANAYYAKPVAWALEKGVTTGTTQTTFRPDATCTRAQIVTFLYRTPQ